ncbi:hypothetical protein [Nocardia brevicatena]|uniref:hypothetical protein n=1 Tax=Nocardia brevicatena TaxID=37327 RepID=UPI0002FEBF0C|nr:hypothetical protein [Nocardia brevicatena]
MSESPKSLGKHSGGTAAIVNGDPEGERTFHRSTAARVASDPLYRSVREHGSYIAVLLG